MIHRSLSVTALEGQRSISYGHCDAAPCQVGTAQHCGQLSTTEATR